MMVNPTLGLAGILLSIIRMIVFYKMGLSHGVTQNAMQIYAHNSVYIGCTH